MLLLLLLCFLLQQVKQQGRVGGGQGFSILDTEEHVLLSKLLFSPYAYAYAFSFYPKVIKKTMVCRRYWSSRRESWPRMVPERSTVSNVFGSRAFERFRYDLTLLEATERNDDTDNAFARLVKESTAALLNSYARKGYPFSAWQVKTLVIQALVSKEAAAVQAQRFYEANEACSN